MLKIEDIVSNTFEHDDGTCPFCGKSNYKIHGSITTQVYYFGVNQNHVTSSCSCSCGENFVRHSKRYPVDETDNVGQENVWITNTSGKLLRGAPNCYESYIYTCKKCNGDVHRNYLDLKGEKAKYLITTVGGGKEYTTHFNCTKCDNGGEVNSDNMEIGWRR